MSSLLIPDLDIHTLPLHLPLHLSDHKGRYESNLPLCEKLFKSAIEVVPLALQDCYNLVNNEKPDESLSLFLEVDEVQNELLSFLSEFVPALSELN